MKITSVCIGRLQLPLTRPFITAVRRTDCVDDVVVMIHTDNGAIGYGSAASTPAITGDSTQSILTALQDHLARQLIGRDVLEFNHLLLMTNQGVTVHSSAKAAIDMALHDLFAQYCGLPLYQYLGGHNRRLDSCLTISAKATDEMVADAMDWVAQSHRTLKIKLGLHPEGDLQRIQAIRAAVGEAITLLVDANQGWSVDDAMTIIDSFQQQGLNIPLIEQPVAAADWQHLKQIRDRFDCDIIADEACFSPKDALMLANQHACDGVNIKLMKCGGLANAQAIYNIANSAGLHTMFGCMLESPIGVAAIASFAASKPERSYADLDPVFLIRDNVVSGGIQRCGHQLLLSDKPGLGIEGFAQGYERIAEIV